MRKHKNIIIAAAVIIAVLAAAWFWGDNYNKGQGIKSQGTDGSMSASAQDTQPPGSGDGNAVLSAVTGGSSAGADSTANGAGATSGESAVNSGPSEGPVTGSPAVSGPGSMPDPA